MLTSWSSSCYYYHGRRNPSPSTRGAYHHHHQRHNNHHHHHILLIDSLILILWVGDVTVVVQRNSYMVLVVPLHPFTNESFGLNLTYKSALFVVIALYEKWLSRPRKVHTKQRQSEKSSFLTGMPFLGRLTSMSTLLMSTFRVRPPRL